MCSSEAAESTPINGESIQQEDCCHRLSIDLHLSAHSSLRASVYVAIVLTAGGTSNFYKG